MKTQRRAICLSLWLLSAIVFNTAIPIRAQRQPQTEEVQIPENKIAASANLKPTDQFKDLRLNARGAEFPSLLHTLFGVDAAAAAKAIDEDTEGLFQAVGDALDEKGNETLQQEIEDRKEKLKADLVEQANQNKVKSNVKTPPKTRKPAAKKAVSRQMPAPVFDWRALAFGFQPLQPLPRQLQLQDGKPDVKVTQTDKEVKAEGESEKNFETDKASLKRTQKAESKFIKDGEVFGVEIKHTETIEGKAKNGNQYFRKEIVMMWSAKVAACPDVKGITAGTGKGSVTAKTTITGDAGTANLVRVVTADTKTTGYVDDDAEMTHYDLEAEAVETIGGYDDAAARKLMTNVTFKDGTYRLRYEMTGNKIEINKTAEGGPRIPAKMGKIVVKMVPGSNVEDVKRTDKAAGALVAGVWNHTNDMYKAARSHWRNYGCLEVVAKAPKSRLKKGEQISIEAETVHKQDGSKVNARLEAGALDATVSPETQQAAPKAKFTYVHGDLEKSDFTIESFSKRGIGIGGLEFLTEQPCAGGLSGKIEVKMRKTEGWTKVTKKGEHMSDQYYSGTAEYKWSFDYNAAFNVSRGEVSTNNEDGSISATLVGAVQAKAARITDEKDNWTTTTDCFPDPPRTAGQNSFSLIKEEGSINGTIDDGLLQINGSKFRIAFGVPEIAAKRTHRTVVKPFGWCMMDQNPSSDETDESNLSFSREAIEIEGAIDPKNPNSLTGSKTFTDELGNEVTISWSLKMCK